MFHIKISPKQKISKTPYDLKGKSSNNENNMESPITTDIRPDFNESNDRKTPNKNTKRLYEKKKRNAGILWKIS